MWKIMKPKKNTCHGLLRICSSKSINLNHSSWHAQNKGLGLGAAAALVGCRGDAPLQWHSGHQWSNFKFHAQTCKRFKLMLILFWQYKIANFQCKCLFNCQTEHNTLQTMKWKKSDCCCWFKTFYNILNSCTWTDRIWNRTRPRALAQNQPTRELISAWKLWHKHNKKDLSCLQ